MKYDGTGSHRPGRGEFILDAAWTNFPTTQSEWCEDHLVREEGARLKLACECEWVPRSRGGVSHLQELMDDFVKLVVVHAPLKVFLFAHHGEATEEERKGESASFESIVERAKELAGCVPSGEKYVLLGWPWHADWKSRLGFKRAIFPS